MDKKKTKIPALRFPGFEGEWEKKKINQIATIKSGTTPVRSNKTYFENGTIWWVKTTDLNNSYIIETEECVTPKAIEETSLKIHPVNSVLVAMYGGFNQIGRTGLLKVSASTNQAISVVNPVDKIVVPEYLIMWFNANVGLWRKFAGSSRKDPNITANDVSSFPIIFPSLPEQQKIADFLTAVDDKINRLTRKKTLLQQYKKGVMQQIFSQDIRFKDDDGNNFPEWEVKKLNEFVEPIKRKSLQTNDNVLTISAGKGFLQQKDRFSQIIAGSSLEKYTLLKKDEFSYNRGNSKSYTYGCIYKLTDYESALVPNVYRSFKLLVGVPDFIEQLFISKYLDKQLRQLISSSARMDGLLNIGEKDFYRCKVIFPCIEEQQKIVDFLGGIDKKIKLVNSQLEKTKEWKKGLLQQMFV